VGVIAVGRVHSGVFSSVLWRLLPAVQHVVDACWARMLPAMLCSGAACMPQCRHHVAEAQLQGERVRAQHAKMALATSLQQLLSDNA
jgi:hypothetical protein